MTITYSVETSFDADSVERLYASVGWTAYTNAMDRLMAGLANSRRVVVARDGDQLVGLCRVISDANTIAYIQDVLVDPAHQRLGIGRRLISEALEPFVHVRQTVLLTDDEPGQRAFYESLGFREIRDLEHETRSFVKFS